MAGLRGRVSSGEQGLAAATAETVLQLVAAANHRVKITGYSISFKGVLATDTPVNVKILRQTGAGTSSAGTVSKDNINDDEALQTTARTAFTVEPTDDNVLDEFAVHPQTGAKVFLPLGQEIIVVGGGRVGVKCNAAQAQTAIVALEFDE